MGEKQLITHVVHAFNQFNSKESTTIYKAVCLMFLTGIMEDEVW